LTDAGIQDDLDPKALSETRPLLAPEEHRAKEWQFNFEMKYPVVGRLTDGYMEVPRPPPSPSDAAAAPTGTESKKDS
jgi:hypothetical protein